MLSKPKHAGFFVLFLLFASTSFAHRYDNVIIFGDSLSDIGNNTWVDVPGRNAKFSHGAPVTNLDPKTQTPKVWIQYLVAQGIFKQRTILPSRLWQGEDLQTNNVDYAWVSAETGNKYLNDQVEPFTYPANCYTPGVVNAQLSCVPSVMQQVHFYLQNVQQLHQQPGQNTLFFIWAGGNDIFDNISRLLYRANHFKQNPLEFFYSKSYAYSWFPTHNLLVAVQTLIAAGVPAQHIIVLNLPDLAKTPGAIHLIAAAFPNKLSKQAWFLQRITGLSHLFNMDLRLFLSLGIRGPVKPNIISVDNIFTEMVTAERFQGYQFTNIQDSCVRNHATPYCTGYLFFNDKHPTTYTGALFAEYIARQS